MQIIGLDVETSGLEQEKGHKIIEIAFLTYDFNTQQLTDTWIQRFDPQRPIDAGAQATHGISYSDLVGEPTWEDTAEEISERMGAADLLVAHNSGFDLPFIGFELLRVGAKVPDVNSVCTMASGRWACPDGKYPKLSELAWALGIEFDPSKAHGAHYDVEIMMSCFFKGLKRGFYQLPKELSA